MREIVDAQTVFAKDGGDVGLHRGAGVAEERVVAAGDNLLVEDGFDLLEVHDHVFRLPRDGRDVAELDGDLVGVPVEVSALAAVAGEEMGGIEGDGLGDDEHGEGLSGVTAEEGYYFPAAGRFERVNLAKGARGAGRLVAGRVAGAGGEPGCFPRGGRTASAPMAVLANSE